MLRCGQQVVFNPKDTNTFASASLDRTVKVGHVLYIKSLWCGTNLLNGRSVPDVSHHRHVHFSAVDLPPSGTSAHNNLVQVWSIGQPTPNFTLEGHDKGVNAVDYFNGGTQRCLGACGHDGVCKSRHQTA